MKVAAFLAGLGAGIGVAVAYVFVRAFSLAEEIEVTADHEFELRPYLELTYDDPGSAVKPSYPTSIDDTDGRPGEWRFRPVGQDIVVWSKWMKFGEEADLEDGHLYEFETRDRFEGNIIETYGREMSAAT